jgi:iron complex transport system substrate-binding protein
LEKSLLFLLIKYILIEKRFHLREGKDMKKFIVFALSSVLFLAACGSNEGKEKSDETKSDSTSNTKTFKQDDGKKVKIPKEPKRIVVLHPTYIGALVEFGHKPVGVLDFVK